MASPLVVQRTAPIRTDGSNQFAYHSMAVRVPSIIRETVERNPQYPAGVVDALMRLQDDLQENAPLRLFASPAPDTDLWAEIFEPRRGETWLGTEWFFSEMLVYRLMMEASRYWSTLQDPFQPFKREELASAELWEALQAALRTTGDLEERLAVHLAHSLWGNRVDLSLKQSAAQGTRALREHLLADDLAAVAAHLVRRDPGTVHVIMDNAGTEQALDLAFVDLLLTEAVAQSVILHVKMHPVLVSDAIVADVHTLLAAMRARGGDVTNLAARLDRHLDDGRLSIVPDFFWNSPGRLRELPGRLARSMRGSQLVVLKGDINYRRATDDALWPAEASFPDAVAGFAAPLLALRTLKSDTLVGVDRHVQVKLDDGAEKDWRTSGTYGVAQFYRG